MNASELRKAEVETVEQESGHGQANGLWFSSVTAKPEALTSGLIPT